MNETQHHPRQSAATLFFCLPAIVYRRNRGELLQDWLLNNQTGATLIRAGVPKDWRVGDKTGRSDQDVTNDVAVLYPPNGARVFVAIYTVAPSVSDKKRSEIVATVARTIVETFGIARED